MSEERYRSYYLLDEAPDRDIDVSFTGVDELNSPSAVAPGFVCSAKNTRFTTGEPGPRKGIAKLPWINRSGIVDSVAQPFDVIHGATSYSDEDGVLWNIIAADGRVYRCRQHNSAAALALPSGVTIAEPVTFVQTKQGLVMFRGLNADPLIMASFDAGFTAITQEDNEISGGDTENPTDGTRPIPRADRGTLIGNRLWIPTETDTERDIIDVSDYLNVTRYAPVRSQGRINQGSNDRLVSVVKFSENAAIAFKEQSIYIVGNIYDDLSAMTLDDLQVEYGICGGKTAVMVGKDLWFLAQERGVCSITQTQQGKLQGVDVPKSALMEKTVARINWSVAKRTATAASHANKFYIAVPLDEAQQCGPNFVVDKSFDEGGECVIDVQPGKRYRVTMGNAYQVTNGNETVGDDGDFVAEGNDIILAGNDVSVPVTTVICRVYEDVNNAVLVFDTLRQQWAGYDTGTALMVSDWLIGTYNGTERLMFVGGDGFINLVDEMVLDEGAYWTLDPLELAYDEHATGPTVDIAVTQGLTYRFVKGTHWTNLLNGDELLTDSQDFVARTSSVRFTLEDDWAEYQFVDASLRQHRWELVEEWVDCDWTSRAYGGQAIGRKKWTDLEIHLATWFPAYQVTGKVEGLRDEFQILPLSGTWEVRSRTAYDKPWDAAPWDETNADDDHDTPQRQDYSVLLTDDTVASGSIQPGVTYFVESYDVTTSCSITYNGNTVQNQQTFTGVAGVSTFSVTSGTPVVYPPGAYLYLGDSGIEPDRLQESVRELRIPSSCRGRGVQIRVRSSQGVVICKGIAPSGVLATRTKGERT